MLQKELQRKDIVYPELSYKIIGCTFDVFNELGAGHHEKYYQRALAESFTHKGVKFKEQVHFPLKYKDKVIGRNYMDFLVEDVVVVELKKGERFSKRHFDQVMEYLVISNLKLGILVNFTQSGVTSTRIVNFNS